MPEQLPPIPASYVRTLRCANAALNVGMALAVVAAAVYALWLRNEPPRVWQVWLCGAAVPIALLWGAFYARYRVRVDARGVTVRSVRSRFFPWQRLTRARLEETDHHGIASCCISLTFSPGESVRISGEMLNLDAVRLLAHELENYLPFEETKAEEKKNAVPGNWREKEVPGKNGRRRTTVGGGKGSQVRSTKPKGRANKVPGGEGGRENGGRRREEKPSTKYEVRSTK